jgi:S1-C subfamily serine protease
VLSEERVIMDIRCRCSGCQAKFKVDAKYAGKKARCPKCQQIVDVPLESLEGSTVTSLPALGAALPAAAGPGIGNSAHVPPKSAVPAPTQSATFPKPAAPLPGGPAAGAPGGFPNLNLTSTKPAATVAASPATASQSGQFSRKKSSPLPLIIAGGIAAVLLVGIGIVGVVALSRPSRDEEAGPRGSNVAAPSGTDATLVIDWTEEDRRGAGLSINGRKEPIPAAGEIKFTLAPGQHRIFLQRRGFEPIDQSVTLVKGQAERFTPQWKASAIAAAQPPVGPATSISSNSNPPTGAAVVSTPGGSDFPIGTAIGSLAPRGFEGWLQNFDLAKREATTGGKKNILVVFGCTDADGETQELARALKTAQASQSLVCVIIDFPRSAEAFNLIEDRGQNEQMLQDFGIKALPTLALTDEQGRAYFLKHQWEDGFDDLSSKIPQWQQNRSEVDRLLAQAQAGDDLNQLAAAAKAVKWVQDNKVWRFYGPEFSQWMNRAQQLDPENKQSLLEVFFEPQWFINLTQIDDEDEAAVSRLASQLDPWVSRKFQDHDRGAKLHMTAAFLLAQVERYDQAGTQIEHAVKYQPKDAKLAEALSDVKRRLENKDVLGSGTGFLISPAGYVLTNHHVIAGEGRIEIRIPGTKDTVPAELIAQDADRDIALLKVAMPDSQKYQPIPVAGDPIRRGAAVAAFGYPLGDELGAGLKFTDGSVSALPDESNEQMYMLDLTVNPGNSGGPLCDRRGNVVGMVTKKSANIGFEDSYGFAVPAADLLKFLDQHLPPEAPRAAASPPGGGALDWDQVDEKVSTGVLMILKKK